MGFNSETGRFEMKFAVVIEPTKTGYGASVVDLPGCIGAGDTLDAVRDDIRSAIEFHIQGMQEDGDPIPTPSIIEFVDVNLEQNVRRRNAHDANES